VILDKIRNYIDEAIGAPNIKVVGHASRGTLSSAGIDLYSEGRFVIRPNSPPILVPLTCIVAIPEGYVGFLCVRSSLAVKGVALTNGVGVIDSDYRGQLKGLFSNLGKSEVVILPGQRIAQLVIAPYLDRSVQIVETLEETDRGLGGFGSTGE